MRSSVNLKFIIVMALLPMLSWACRGGGGTKAGAKPETAATAARPVDAPAKYTYTVKKAYPHNTSSYTQGLYWHDGYLWEGTGQYGQSALQKVKPETGKIVERVDLEAQYFGEGIALAGGKIYQLTWTNGKAFVYDGMTIERTGEFNYSGEGWGLTTDGEVLYMSNGSHTIYILDPEDFSRRGSIDVMYGKRRLQNINELEWIDGKIWANVYLTDSIVIIDPATGKVEGIIDMEGLLPAAERTPETDVLNGIAYDSGTGRIFVTGKNWSRLFEIEVTEQ